MSTQNRSLKPYPPASVSAVDPGTACNISWFNRNRTILQIRKQTDPTETPETGQTTTVSIYDPLGTLIHTEAGVTGTSFSYTHTQEITDAGSLQTSLTIKVKAVRGSYSSAEQVIDFLRAGRIIDGLGDGVIAAGTNRVVQ